MSNTTTILLIIAAASPVVIFLPFAIRMLSIHPRFDLLRALLLGALTIVFDILATWWFFVATFNWLPQLVLAIYLISVGAGSVSCAAVLFWCTGSKRVPLQTLLAGLLAVAIFMLGLHWRFQEWFWELFLVACLAWHVVTMHALWRWRRFMQRGVYKGRCARCLYDLSELDTDTCPECGSTFDRSLLSLQLGRDEKRPLPDA